MDIHYVEYGKAFSENDASDFVLLVYSDPLTLEKAGQSRCEVWLDGALAFPDNSKTPFAQQIGKVSVALLATRDGYLFTQIQRRKEGELSRRLGFVPRLDRPYNQERFILLSPEDIRRMFENKASLYTNLLYDRPTPEALYPERFSLKDYRISDRPDPKHPEIAPPPQPESGPEPTSIAPISVEGSLLGAVKFITNALVNSAALGSQTKQSILIKAGEMKLMDKLAIVQMIQYLVYPRLGVITFAFDYVTDQSVALRFFAPPIPETLLKSEHEFDLASGDNNFADDYFTLAARITPDELYHPTLRKYLLSVYQNKPLSTREAYEVFLAVEKGNRIADKAWLSDRLINYFRYILQENDFESILCYFNNDEKTRILGMDIDPLLGTNLLANLAEYPREKVPDRVTIINALTKYYPHLAKSSDSLNKVLGHLNVDESILLIKEPKTVNGLFRALLEFQLNLTGNRLASYYRFHLAMPKERRTDQIYNFLQEAVKGSPASDLDIIPEQDKLAIYSELLRARREIDDHKNLFISFVSDDLTSTKQGPCIIQALLQRASPGLAELFNRLQPEDPRLQTDILGELHQELDLEKTNWYLKNLPALTTDLFNQAVEWFVQPVPADLVNKAKPFKELLVMGQRLYATHSADTAEQSLLHNLPPTIKRPLVDAGRGVASKVPDFAEWWFYTEIAKMDSPSIETYYAALRQELDRSELSLKSTTPEFQFLMNNGDSEKGISLQKACMYFNTNKPNEELFWAVLNVWLKSGLPLPIADITKLIERLPETKRLLIRTVNDDAQASSLSGLSANKALKWLESSQGEERKAYFSPQGEDMLFMRLHALQKPDLAFIWRMLVYETGAYTKKVSWGNYLEDCDYWLDKARKINLPSDSKLNLYVNLAKSLQDPAAIQDETKRSNLQPFLPESRAVLALIAEQTTVPFIDSVENIINLWIYLLGFWMFEDAPLIQKHAAETLRINLERSDLENFLVDYHLDRLSLSSLQQFCEKNGVSADVIRKIKSEIERRRTPDHPPLPSIPSITSIPDVNPVYGFYSSNPPTRPIHRQKARGFSRISFSLGIWLLVLILLLAVFAIIMVGIIIINPDFLSRIPDILSRIFP